MVKVATVGRRREQARADDLTSAKHREAVPADPDSGSSQRTTSTSPGTVTAPAARELWKSSFGEATGPVDSGGVRVYGPHTSGDVDAPEVRRIARDFRKRGEENAADLSV